MNAIRQLVAVVSVLICYSASCENRVWIGGDGGDWDEPTNWSPEGVPSADDDIAIDGKWVRSAGSVSAKSIAVTGAKGMLAVGGTTSTFDGQVGADPNSNVPVVLAVTGDLVLDGGQLSVGGRRQTRGIAATIGGDFTVRNGAKAYFYAGATDGIDAIDQVGSSAKLYANANKVTVTGDINVGSSSFLYPENEGLTGTPVFFYAANFNLAEGGTVSTVGRGWHKYTYAEGDVYPVGAVSDSNNSSVYSYAFGQGGNFNVGAGYGANTGATGTPDVRHITAADGTYETVKKFRAGFAYGSPYAPFLPGSPNGSYHACVRGAGSFNLFLSGVATICGTITARATDTAYGGPSGGGIWLAASAFDVALSAQLIVEGAKCNYTSSGGAGRIALVVGATQAELDALAAGVEPTLAVADLYGCNFNILGGYKNSGSGGRSESGTAKLVYNSATVLPIAVTATPTAYSTAMPAYGLHVCSKAALPASFTVADAGVYPSEYANLRRFAHDGFVTSNATGVVEGELADETDPITVTWQWTKVEDLVRVRPVGGGTISVGGQSYAETADVWMTAGCGMMEFAATDGTGAFNGWCGDFPGGHATGATLTAEIVPGLTVWGVFSDAESFAKCFVGENGGRWDVAANWSPAGVPTPVDDVTIDSKQVKSFGMTAAKTLTLTAGKLGIGGDATDTTKQTLPTAFQTFGCGLYVAGDVTATGASELSVGAQRMTPPVWGAEIGGNATLSGKTKMTVYAPPYAGEVDEKGKIALASYYTSAFVFKVGGALTLEDTAVVYPDADIQTGNPVRFEVGGDVTIGATASFNSTTRGWGWLNYVDEGLDPRYLVKEGNYYTLSPGYGNSWGTGGAYGGGNATAPRKAFGFAYAPYLSGGVDGSYSPCRAGGQVWIKTPGTINLNGTIVANGGTGGGTSSKSSGGGVWLIAKKLVGGTSAKIQADGGAGGNAATASGCGGRVSIALGVKDEDLEVLARGDCPEGLSYSDTISIVTASALGANANKDGTTGLYNKAPDGTLTTVTGEVDAYPMEIVSVPVACIAEGLDYAPTNVEKGAVWSLTIAGTGYDPADPERVRYSLDAWVISNSTEEVARGTGPTATFTAGTGPFSLTWHWANRETRGLVVPNDTALGSVRANGGDAAATADVWNGESVPYTFEAVPADGAEFLYWTGDVPYGVATNRTITVTADSPAKLTPIFRTNDTVRTRTWVGAEKKVLDWNTPTNWEPANIPGFEDDVIVPRGTADATNGIVVGSLTITGSAKVQVAQSAKSGSTARLEEGFLTVARDVTLTNTASLAVGVKEGEIRCNVRIGGDFTLASTNTFSVAAGKIEGDFTFATGSGEVRVGGHMNVRGKSVVYPYSERYTGGSIVFRLNRLTLAEEASFNAVNAGFRYYGNRSPTSWGPGLGGNEHVVAGGYGGFGANYTATLGRTYGFEYAPIHPGSSKGVYGDHSQGGGGLIRIHADKATIAGTLNARAIAGDTSASSGAGGGIWVTCTKRLDILPTAVLTAKGGYRCTGAAGPGGGGRIALAWPISDADIQELAETGMIARWRGMARRDVTEKFLAEHPGVTVNVENGENSGGVYTGTFRVLDATRYGLRMIVR